MVFFSSSLQEPAALAVAFTIATRVENVTEGRRGNEKGLRAELRTINLLQTHLDLAWVRHIRKATKREDGRGIDVIVETFDIGPLYIQVKSSHRCAFDFLKRKRKAQVTIVVVNDKHTDDVLRKELKQKVCGLRHHILTVRKNRRNKKKKRDSS